jgi:hypothetical protein
MYDFSFEIFTLLLNKLKNSGYTFPSFSEYLNKQDSRTVIFRHDLDARVDQALVIAKIQNKLNTKGTYFLPIETNGYNSFIINEICNQGHEIGYHYNDLVHCNGNYDQAIRSFQRNLELLRTICDVKTICMDGSPLSKWDNRDLWNKYNYRDFGIIGEPYFDINPNEVFYLTDTGRCWDGDKYSVRDKFEVKNEEFTKLRFHTTQDIMKAIDEDRFPDKVMMTFHPQRWTNNPIEWTKELIWQGVKNEVKRWFFVKK